MPSYLLQVAYTPEAMAVMIKQPQNRAATVGAAVEKLGGKVTGFWMAFGEYDIVGIIDMPDNTTAAAFAMAIAAGGSCKAVHTTPLLTIEESMAAMEKAAHSTYKPITT